MLVPPPNRTRNATLSHVHIHTRYTSGYTHCTHSTHTCTQMLILSNIKHMMLNTHAHTHMMLNTHAHTHTQLHTHISHTHTYTHISHSHTHSPHQTGPKGVLTDFYRNQQEEQRKKVLEEKKRKELIEKHTAAIKSSAHVSDVCLSPGDN